MPPHFAAMEVATGSWPALALRALCITGVIDALAAHGASAQALADALDLHAPSVLRTLRFLAGYDVVRERARGTFELTPIGRAAAQHTRESVGAFVRYAGEPWQLSPWMHLDRTLRTGVPAFDALYGSTFFEYVRTHDDAGTLFDDAMLAVSHMHAEAIARAYDFKGVTLVCDVGAGAGLLVQAILSAHPSMRTIVFDTERAVVRARDRLAAFAESVRFEAGDFFERVPGDADAYILSHILHDWDDAACERILRNVRTAMPERSRVLAIESVLPAQRNVWDQARLTDMQMLTVLRGRERTLDEYRALAAAAGLHVSRVIPTAASENILELTRPD